MITEIPTAEEFAQSGTAYLNLAWESTVQLALNFDNADIDEWDRTGEVTDEYWSAAQRPLATAVTLVQQGTEFLLKERIAAVSPFLLISADPSGWPRGCQSNDTPFSQFKTIDAQDLLRVHDTVAESRLSPQFADRFNTLRRQRNSIMHTVDRGTRFTATEVITSILEISDNLLGPCSWVSCRRSFLETDPDSVANSSDYVECVVSREMSKIIDLLDPAALKRFFGFNKRQRRYTCYNCYAACRDWNLPLKTAQLKPNTPTSSTVYCFVCEETLAVKRRACEDEDCKGNVIVLDDDICLTCMQSGRSGCA